MSKITIINISIFFIYTALVIGIEPLYRDSLFDYSLSFEENLQKNASKSTSNFFSFVSNFGTGAILIPFLIILVLCFPINKSYAYLSVLIYAYYFDNLMKIIYGNPRPFWVKNSLFTSCNGGFGNPSGHSFSSISIYLTLWHIITDFLYFKSEKKGKIIRILLLVLFLIFALLILFSRLYLAAHSINQVLYGGLLGLSLYFVIMFVFSFHSMNSKQFFDIFRKKSNIIYFSIWYIILIIVGFLCWRLIDNKEYLYESLLFKMCPDLEKYRTFQADGLFGVLSVFGIIGGHYGLVYLAYYMDKHFKNSEDDIIRWNASNSFLKHFYKILLAILFALPLILIFSISGKAALPIIFIFKVSFPYLVGVFNIFGPFIHCSISLKIANPEIYIKKNNFEIQPSKLGISNNFENI